MVENSKNVNTATVETQGGDFRIGDNYHKSLEYKELQERIEELKELVANATDKEKTLKYSQRLNEAEKKLAGFIADVKDLYELLTKIPLNTDRLRLAKMHFEAGEYKEARAILNAEEMAPELTALLQQKEDLNAQTVQNQQHLTDKANEYLILARLTAIDFNNPNRFNETKSHFESSLKASIFYNNAFEYAHFLQKHNFSEKAIEYYQQSLLYVTDLANKATIQNNLASLYKDKKNLAEAEKFLSNALNIYQGLAINNPAIHEPNIAMVLHNLGGLYSSNGSLNTPDRDYCEFIYEKALEIRRKLCAANPTLHLVSLARTLNDFAVFHKEQNDFVEAQKLYEEVLVICHYQRIPLDEHEIEVADVIATTLDNLATVYSLKKELKKAEYHYEQAFIISQSLITKNPYSYLPNFVRITTNFAVFYQESMPDKTKSLEYACEAMLSIFPLVGISSSAKPYLNRTRHLFVIWKEDEQQYLMNHSHELMHRIDPVLSFFDNRNL